MKLRVPKFFYYFKLTFNGIFRNGIMNLASVIVLFSSLVVTGTAWLLYENLDANLKDIDSYNKIVVFMDKSTKEERIAEIGDKLLSLTNIVEVVYVSSEDAMKEMESDFGDFSYLLEMYGDENPFKPSFRITYKSASDVSNVIYNIEQIPEIVKYNSRQDVALKIEDLKNVFSLVFVWLVVLLLVVSVFVIINTINAAVSTRSKEIAIMRYVGATKFFIGFPYFLQGIIIGAFSAGIAYFVQYYLYEYFALELLGNYDIVTVIPFDALSSTLLLGFFVIGIATSVIGSVISLRRYTNV
ncbi:MAG: FtsX-like permease family protein [Ruminococcaceae bacterium]|nr:FtsX-like permease family protein [Oscillospiraceae bacterium]